MVLVWDFSENFFSGLISEIPPKDFSRNVWEIPEGTQGQRMKELLGDFQMQHLNSSK